jgi:hypothetical protein
MKKKEILDYYESIKHEFGAKKKQLKLFKIVLFSLIQTSL